MKTLKKGFVERFVIVLLLLFPYFATLGNVEVAQASDYDEATIKGTFGTADWYIKNGTTELHILGGEFGVAVNIQNGTGNTPDSPWWEWESGITKIIFDEKVIANKNSSYLFNGLATLTSIEGLDKLDTSKVEDMKGMFRGIAVTSLDLSQFDTRNVKEMTGLFNWCKNLKNIDLSSFDTSKVTNMVGMFAGCNNLESITFGDHFDTSNVVGMVSMFHGCNSLKSIDVSKFDTSNVIDMAVMFAECSSLKNLDLTSFDTSNVVDMMSMFAGCSVLETLDLSSFDTSKTTNMAFMFQQDFELTSLKLGKNFKTNNVTRMELMFEKCRKLETIDLSSFTTSNVTNMQAMFSGCWRLKEIDVSNFNTSNVLDMTMMFYDCQSLVDLDVANFDISKTNNVRAMFESCKNLKSLNISNFDVSHTDSGNILSGLLSLRKLTLGANARLVANQSGLFDISLQNYGGYTPEAYTGSWQNIGTSTDENRPNGNYVFTSNELMANYNGTQAGTYVWQPKYYSVTWNGVHGIFIGGTTSVTNNQLLYGEATPTPENFTPPFNYVFDGWEPMIENTVTKDMVYTAKWQHRINESVQPWQAKRIISYQYADGTKAAETVEQTLTFTRNLKSDMVDGTVLEDYWDKASDNFPEITSPTIPNWQADKAKVPAKTITWQEVLAVQDAMFTIKETVIYDHGKSSDVDEKNITRTIQYKDKATGNTLAPDEVQTVTFTREKTTNLVTGEFLYGSWNEVTQTFSSKNSPIVANYTAETPTVASQVVTPNDLDTTVQVYYTKNANVTVDEEVKEITRTIQYKDKVTGEEKAPDVLQKVKFTRNCTTDLNTGNKTYGAWNVAEQTFATVKSPEIAGCTADKLVVPSETVKPEDKDILVTVEYTQNSNVKIEEDVKEITRTIQYKDKVTGEEKAPDVLQKVKFTRNCTTDLNTGNKTYGAWNIAEQTFATVKSPEIVGYTADKTVVPSETVKPEDKDILVTVEYTQNPNVKIEEDVKEITRTIEYKDKVTGEEKAPDVLQKVKFTRNCTTDLNTGNKIYGAWNIAEQTFATVKSPEIAGYTADKLDVPSETVKPEDKDILVTVEYTKNPNVKIEEDVKEITRTIEYKEKSTGKQLADNSVQTLKFTRDKITDLATEEVKFGAWNVAEQTFATVKSPEIAGYTADKLVVPSETVKPEDKDILVTVEYTQNPNVKIEEDIKEITRTIQYKDKATGKELANTVVQTLKFTRYKITDLTTGEVKFGAWNIAEQTFTTVKSPEIAGYTADKTVIPSETVKPEDKDITLTVYYVKTPLVDTQIPAPVIIRYVDETGKSLLKDKVITGKLNEKFTEKAPSILGYKLKSSESAVEFTITTKEQTIIFVYESTNAQLPTTYEPTTSSTTTTSVNNNTTTSTSKTLPSTNEAKGNIWSMLGMCIISLVVGVFVKRKKARVI
ncbi:LPXTG-motif cell wall anchor domain-containing protein [Pilibacter termitis]|uniref:LPXTG-motif cell wall anchor domain-containing protein n=1 Tax=Pilibacter termitis TaxID=263852 RepID=A0A1T4L215_9ENTE|nr:BspA family leucine-rich repeat surface protein [Pilibacter termitis]SJZ48631.1 LPXTG-motif cell wall anchor domain-containing protein [Pilibacter termitis]